MKIKRIYKQSLPATRFIGKKYSDDDRVDGSFGAKWGEAFETGLFERLEAIAGEQFFEDSGAEGERVPTLARHPLHCLIGNAIQP